MAGRQNGGVQVGTDFDFAKSGKASSDLVASTLNSELCLLHL
jgi:hypothetical protein